MGRIEKITNFKDLMKVPDSIKIVNDDNTMGILFNLGKQFIFFDGRVYNVGNTFDIITKDNTDKYLKRVYKDTSKAGDVLFRSNIEEYDLDNISNYCILIDGNRYVFVNNLGEVRYSNLEWKYWYKVINK